MISFIMFVVFICSIIDIMISGATWYYITALAVSSIYLIIKFNLYKIVEGIGDVFGD